MQVPQLHPRPANSELLGRCALLKCVPLPHHSQNSEPRPGQQADITVTLTQCLSHSLHVCARGVGIRSNQMGTYLGPAGRSRGGGTVSRGASGALPLCDLRVMFLKALKRLLNTPEGGVPKEFRGLTLQRQEIRKILYHQMTFNKEEGTNRSEPRSLTNKPRDFC